MKKIAFMFPGQGAQAVKMGLDLYENFKSAKYVFDFASDVLNKDIKKLCFEGPDELLKQTTNTQSCLVTTSIAAYSAFLELTGNSISPNYTLGHSLGEYCAMYVSSVMDLENTLKAIQMRADLMQKACETSKKGSMAAILGSSEDVIKECIAQISDKGVISIANYNDPNQIVITGEENLVVEASNMIKEKGARRVVILNVSGGFHSKLMEDATVGFNSFVKNLSINDAKIPVVTNIDANLTTKKEDFIEKMPNQISNSVLWVQSIRKLLDLEVDTFIEFGSGKVLSGLNRKICPEYVKTYNVSDKASLQETVNSLNLLNV